MNPLLLNSDAANDWQTQCSGMKERLTIIFNSGDWTDCSFKFESNGSQIEAHKLVLALVSPVFAKQFYGSLPEKGPILITDIQPTAFKALLGYIYTNEVKISSLQMAWDLYYAANKYILPHLKDRCSQYLSSNLTRKNVCQVYEIASMHEDSVLMMLCLKLIRFETTAVLESETFLEANVNTVNKILDMDPLTISNELVLFKAIAKYSEALKKTLSRTTKSEDIRVDNTICFEDLNKEISFKKSKYETSQDNLSDTDNNETVMEPHTHDSKNKDDCTNFKIRAMVKKIRFLTLSPKQFADCDILSQFLTKEEILALSMNIASRHTTVPMPDGFSKSRMQRNVNKSQNVAIFRSAINGVLSFDVYESPTFYASNVSWYIIVKPIFKTTDKQRTKHVAFIIHRDLGPDTEETYQASCEVKILSSRNFCPPLKVCHRFTREHNFCGCAIKWEIIESVIENNALNFEFKITVN